jgi:hypothetical protein
MFEFAPLLAASGAGDKKSLLEELWDYFVQTYLESGEVYTNLGMEGSGSMMSLTSIVFGIFFGIVLASVLTVYDKRVIGSFVRKMLYCNAVGKENAKTLFELEEGERSAPARALRHSSNLRRVVKCVEEEEYYAELIKTREEYEKRRQEDRSLPEFKSVDYVFNGTEHYYIPEDKKYSAETRFSKSGTAWWSLPVALLVAFACAFAIMIALPYILKLLDQLIGAIKAV